MDEVPNTFPQLFYAYLAVWGILSLYILSLGLRLSLLEKKNHPRS